MEYQILFEVTIGQPDDPAFSKLSKHKIAETTAILDALDELVTNATEINGTIAARDGPLLFPRKFKIHRSNILEIEMEESPDEPNGTCRVGEKTGP